MHELAPKAATIGMLVNPDNPNTESDVSIVREAAGVLGHSLLVVTARADREFDSAYATLVERQTGALVVAADPFFNSWREQLVALSARHAIPAIYEWREFAQLGGLMSYGSSVSDAWRQVGAYAGHFSREQNPPTCPFSSRPSSSWWSTSRPPKP